MHEFLSDSRENEDIYGGNGLNQMSRKAPNGNDKIQIESTFIAENTSDKNDNLENTISAVPVTLKKNIDFISCLGILIGSIIGSGIFVSPQGVLIGTGSIGFSLIAWAFCGFLTFIGAMVFAELGLLLPYSGGNYIYLLEAFPPNRKKRNSWISLVPFLYFWIYSLFVRPASTAVQGLATAQYIMRLAYFGECGVLMNETSSAIVTKLLAVMFVMAITGLNCHSSKLSTRIMNLVTFIKLAACMAIIIAGFTKLSYGMNASLYTGFEGTTFSGISVAYFSGIWAYSGWEFLNLVTMELINPKRDLLRSLVATCFIITSIYLLVNVSYFTVLSKETFLSSEAVAVTFADSVAGKTGAVVIIATVAISIFGASFGESFTGNRVLYAASREGHMVELFSFIHFQRMTPSAAIALNGVIALLLLPHSSVLGLISMSGFVTSFFSLLTVASLLILRKHRTKHDVDFQVPFVFILISMATSATFVIEPFITNLKIEFLFLFGLILVGAMFFTIFVHYKKRLPALNGMTSFVQKILQIVPPHPEDT